MNLTTIAWLGEDGSVNTIWNMKRIYDEKVDKDEYHDFVDWLYDMERSGTYICHDFTDKFLPYEDGEPDYFLSGGIGMSEFDFTCQDCGSDVLQDQTSLDGWDDCLADGEIFIDLTCRECGTEFFAVFRFDKYIVTYRKGDAE